MELAARSSGGRCVVARAAETVVRPTLLGTPAGLALTDNGDGEHVDRVATAELPGGRVLGPHRAIITGRGDLVQEISQYFGTSRAREHPLFLDPLAAAPLDVEGRLGVLASRGDSNYYHFLFDALPRIGVLEQSPGIAAPDRWYVPAQTRFQRELLDLIGIGRDQRIDASTHPHVRADMLVVPGPPAMTEKNPPWVVDFLRGHLLTRVDAPARRLRIYVTRGPSANNRSVTNEAAVLRLLTAEGFEPIDPGEMSVVEQIQAFAAADLIVAPHGAALANLAFASPGAAVVELFPAGFLLPDYWRLACGVPGLRYRYLSASGGPRRPSRGAAIVRDIEVDVSALAAILHEL
jgi:capsular polysaccharide biosynthesis protein